MCELDSLPGRYLTEEGNEYRGQFFDGAGLEFRRER